MGCVSCPISCITHSSPVHPAEIGILREEALASTVPRILDNINIALTTLERHVGVRTDPSNVIAPKPSSCAILFIILLHIRNLSSCTTSHHHTTTTVSSVSRSHAAAVITLNKGNGISTVHNIYSTLKQAQTACLSPYPRMSRVIIATSSEEVVYEEV